MEGALCLALFFSSFFLKKEACLIYVVLLCIYVTFEELARCFFSSLSFFSFLFFFSPRRQIREQGHINGLKFLGGHAFGFDSVH